MITEKEKENFKLAAEKANAVDEYKSGIGTLSEKGLHRTIKYFIDEREENHEVAIGAFFADVKNSEGIFEIQTASTSKLQRKLKCFIKDNKVTVVLPLITDKRIVFFDSESAEVINIRLSPKHRCCADALAEIFFISEFLDNENFCVKIMLMSATEYRAVSSESKARKKPNTKIMIKPDELVDIITVSSVDDIRALLPRNLPERFFAKEFTKRLSITPRKSYYALKLLRNLNIVKEVGKNKNAVIYSFS